VITSPFLLLGKLTTSGSVGAATTNDKQLKARIEKMRSFKPPPCLLRKESPVVEVQSSVKEPISVVEIEWSRL
jgi:hypothetical protein